VIAIIGAAFVVGLVYANILYWKTRAAMTRDERQQFERDLRIPGDW